MIYLDYEDYLIRPHNQTRFTSRAGVNLVNKYGHVPLCAANMKGVGTLDMALALQKHKMLTFVCKNTPFEDWTNLIDDLDPYYVVPSFGITEDDVETFTTFMQLFSNVFTFVCIDVANGHMKDVLRVYRKMQRLAPNTKFIVGNIANTATLHAYDVAGIWAAKVGIGSGSVCTTRLVTGVGVPQASLLQEMVQSRNGVKSKIKIIADGGIKTIGDVSKAFVMGADYVMMGGALSGHKEGGIAPVDGLIDFQGSSAIQDKDYVTPEGITVSVLDKGPVDGTVKQILGGLRSTGSYINANLDSFHNRRDLLIQVRRQKNDIYEQS